MRACSGCCWPPAQQQVCAVYSGHLQSQHACEVCSGCSRPPARQHASSHFRPQPATRAASTHGSLYRRQPAVCTASMHEPAQMLPMQLPSPEPPVHMRPDSCSAACSISCWLPPDPQLLHTMDAAAMRRSPARSPQRNSKYCYIAGGAAHNLACSSAAHQVVREQYQCCGFHTRWTAQDERCCM